MGDKEKVGRTRKQLDNIGGDSSQSGGGSGDALNCILTKLESMSTDMQSIKEKLNKLENDNILIKIFNYLDPYYVSRTIALVCRRFTRILSDEVIWKQLLTKTLLRSSSSVPSILHPFHKGLKEIRWWCSRDMLWRDLAVQINILEKQFKTHRAEMIRQNFSLPHFAAVDTVKIIGNDDTIVSGGRDRMINLWKVDPDTLDLKQILTDDRSHDGWVWDTDSCTSDTFCTCGWDNNVNYWSVSNGLNKLATFRCGKPVMAVSCTRGLIAAGLHIRKIVLIDPRIENVSNFHSIDVHRHAITDVLLVPEKNLLLSISEEKTLSIYDLRQQRSCCDTIVVSRFDSFPRRLEYRNDVIHIGDSRGNIHFYHLGSDSNYFPELQVINVGTSRLITAVVPHLSGVTVGTTDGYIRIIYPSDPPISIWEEKLLGEITAIDQRMNILAVSTAQNNVSVFRPCSI